MFVHRLVRKPFIINFSNLDDCMVFTFYQTASNKQTKKSLGCHQASSLDMIMLSHPQGVATAVVYSTADGAMWAKDREMGRFRRSVNLLGKMEYNHRKKKHEKTGYIQDSRYHGW